MGDLTKREQEHAAFGSGIFCPNKNVFHVSRARGLHVRPTLAIVWWLWRQGISHVEPLETFMKTKIETHEALMAPQIQNFWAYLISLIVRLTVMNPRSIENFCFVTAKNKIYSDKLFILGLALQCQPRIDKNRFVQVLHKNDRLLEIAPPGTP